MSNSTPAQQEAIAARGNVLVVAGAGTGKTRTLVQRCLRLLREGASLEQMLIVTFTNAAAAEMRVRLRKALEDEAAASVTEPGRAALCAPSFDGTGPEGRAQRGPTEHIAEQIALLDTAQISTLHSFCLGLLREHFHALAIDPQVVVLDERQTRPLARECLTEVLAGHYAGRHPHSAAIQQLIRRGGRGSDENLRKLVWKLHCHAQSLPDPDAWFTAMLADSQNAEPLRWHEWLLTACRDWRANWRPLLQAPPIAPAFVWSRAALRDGADSLPALAGVLRAVTEADRDWPHGTKKFRADFAKFFDDAEFLFSLTGSDGSAAALAEDWDWSRHEMAGLLEITRQFTARFTEAKRQLGGVDFADVEQLSLRLLHDERTGAARRCRERFAHVFVDEYQDINAAQDAILCAVSRTDAEANRFLVGDIKQSIYRFRLTDPRIFASYARAWREGSKVIALSDNFRSNEAVLNFVNALFRPLMRASVGGVTYDVEAELRFGNAQERRQLAASSDAEPCVELHVLTSDEAADSTEPDDTHSDSEELLAIEREARFVATRLRDLRDGGHAVWDETAHEFRPVQWRDMVVLMRSPGSRGEAFAKEFHRAGVPLHAERGGFYDSLEVSDLLNLLRLLDNPLQDLPLLAVLRCPLVGMSLEELVTVRAADAQGLIWDALTKFRAAGPEAGRQNSGARSQEPEADQNLLTSASAGDGWAKADEFLSRFVEWRQLIRLGSLTQCLERVLAETHYEALLLAEARGAESVANVRRLLDLARQFDPLQRQGLHRFLRFIQAQEEAALDHDPAPLPTEDAVRLMSIHQSKGLEFPVVVLAGMGVRFNQRDLSGDILLDATMGLCPMVSPPQSQRRFPSLPHWLAKQCGQRELLGEELRLLYVALTRARDTLLLCGTDSGKDAAEKWRGPAAEVNDHALLKARCPLDWLRPWLPTVTSEADWRSDAAGRNELLSWNFYAAEETAQSACRRLAVTAGGVRPNEGVVNSPQSADVSETEFVAKLQLRLGRSYPHTAATHEPAKTSVSVLRRRAEAEEAESTELFSPRELPRASRRRDGQLTATQIGVAHHTFLQCVDLSATGTLADLMAEAERWQSRGLLSEREAAALSLDDLLRFWSSEAGRLIRHHAREVQREVPFTARFSQREIREELSPSLRALSVNADDFVIVQGVVDLAVFRAHEIWLLDYKTDHFDLKELPAKIREHRAQLRLYAHALTRIYKKPVTRTWLHFLALGRTEEL